MKQLFQGVGLLAVMLLTTFSSFAFKENGIYYNVLSKADRTVEVTYGSYNGEYTGDITIPERVKDEDGIVYDVVSIGEYAFSGCTLVSSVTIPNSVTSIGVGAFMECKSITYITIPDSVTSISINAFSRCTSLQYISISISLTSINDRVFYGCTSLQEVTIPSSVISIGKYAFTYCESLSSVTTPSSVRVISGNPFIGCISLKEISVEKENPNYTSLDGVLFSKNMNRLCAFPGDKRGVYKIPDSVTTIEEWAFSNCSFLTLVDLGNSLNYIKNYAFNGCYTLKNLTLPNSIVSIGNFAFYGCKSLPTLTIPNLVNTIGEGAFGYCLSLSSTTIPSSVFFIDKNAFQGCTALKEVNCLWEDNPVDCAPEFPENVMDEAILYVPKGTKDKYKKVDPWRNFLNIQEKDFSGVDDVAADEVDVKVVDGAIFVSSDAPVCIYNMQGRTVYSGNPTRIDSLPAGLYIVTRAGKSVKVLVP